MLAILIGALVLGLPTASAHKPLLRVSEGPPLRVHGDHFGAKDQVTVTVLTGLGRRVAHVTAVRGTFNAKFDLPSRGCGAAFAVTARGASGLIAHLTFADAPICVPPPRD
jgi:hypothetical protein